MASPCRRANGKARLLNTDVALSSLPLLDEAKGTLDHCLTLRSLWHLARAGRERPCGVAFGASWGRERPCGMAFRARNQSLLLAAFPPTLQGRARSLPQERQMAAHLRPGTIAYSSHYRPLQIVTIHAKAGLQFVELTCVVVAR